MIEILIIVYVIAGFWAAGVVLYENKIVVAVPGALFIRKLLFGILLGWIFIPIAIFKRLTKKR